jgi:Peptidase family M23
MLISPPFLLTRNADETEDDWIDRCMVGGLPGQGAFPVSYQLGWHGGMHLDAPMNGDQSEPVRAIADGEVVFVRQPTPQPAGPLPPDHAQAYNGWTDNGVVVIRHTTEIGEGANAAVTFFSITMHLSQIDPAIQQGRRVYRKAQLGTAGQIYGNTQRQIHFEIVCDADNLQRFVGRTSGDLATDADGRTDAIYGAMYFHLPAGAEFFSQQPAAHLVQATALAVRPRGRNQPVPDPAAVLVPMAAAYTSTEALVVELRYASGEGAAANRGDAYLSTYQENGTRIGDALEENEGEYNLYSAAVAISNAYPQAGRPAPSAVFELLRFGRVIGPDALTPADVPHWRQVRYPGGQGWVNLNAATVHKFSDADFPQWKGWQLIDDAVGQDSRCDSALIRGWLDANSDGSVNPTEAQARLDQAEVAQKVSRTICKFPTEWDAATIDARWGWLKTSTPENPEPLNDESFEALRAHITALAFWPGGIGIDAHHWHWQPREFVRQFRKCGWLSPAELVQLLPGNHPVGFVRMRDRLTVGAVGRVQTMPAGMHVALGKVCRKYFLESPLRRAHFWGQIAQETDQLQTVREYASGADYEGRADLGNTQPGDGVRFRGRGVIQVTGRVNYTRYGTYRGSNFTAGQNNLILENDAYAASDASTFYWVAEETRDRVNRRWILDGLVGISRRADNRTFSLLTEDAAIRADVSSVTRQVNRAELHLENRIRYFKYAYLHNSDITQLLQHGSLRP